MSFLAIIIAVVLLQVWGSGSRLQHDGWFRRWQSTVNSWGFGPVLKLILLLLPPVLVALYVLTTIKPLLFGLLWLGLTVVVLLYSFGRGNFDELMKTYRSQSQSGDFEAAYLSAGEQFGWEIAAHEPIAPWQLHALIQRELLYEGYQRWFAVLFYFVLLGPVGALVYRLLQLCRGNFVPQLTSQLLFLADWVPARLLAATFTVTGNFVGSRDALVRSVQNLALEPRKLLYTVATPALGIEPVGPADAGSDFGEEVSAQNSEYGELLSRSAVGWVAVMAMLVVLS